MSATLDDSEFQKTLGEYIAKCPDRLEQIINRKMYFILRAAWEKTPLAARGKIIHDLNIVGFRQRGKKRTKSGRVRWNSRVGKASVLFLIIQSRRAKSGLVGLYGKAMERAATKLANARINASGTMRRGWLKSLLAFAAKSKGSVPSDAFGARPKGAGEARTAEAGWNPTAEAAFEVAIERGARFDPRLEQAIQTAFDAEEASMQKYLEDELGKDIQEISA